MKKTKTKRFSELEERFIQEYMKDLNGTQAVHRAGYNMTDGAAAVQANALLRRPNVRKKLETLMEKRAKKAEIKAEEVLKELKILGHSDVRGLFDDSGCIKPTSQWPDELAKAVASIEVFEEFQGRGNDREFIGYTKKVKFWDKPKALELMGKHKKLFTEKMEHTNPDGSMQQQAQQVVIYLPDNKRTLDVEDSTENDATISTGNN